MSVKRWTAWEQQRQKKARGGFFALPFELQDMVLAHVKGRNTMLRLMNVCRYLYWRFRSDDAAWEAVRSSIGSIHMQPHRKWTGRSGCVPCSWYTHVVLNSPVYYASRICARCDNGGSCLSIVGGVCNVCRLVANLRDRARYGIPASLVDEYNTADVAELFRRMGGIYRGAGYGFVNDKVKTVWNKATAHVETILADVQPRFRTLVMLLLLPGYRDMLRCVKKRFADWSGLHRALGTPGGGELERALTPRGMVVLVRQAAHLAILAKAQANDRRLYLMGVAGNEEALKDNAVYIHNKRKYADMAA
jgi:hypothetical protein